MSGRWWNWFLLRMLWISSPTWFIIALALVVQGELEAAGLVTAAAVVMVAAGFRTRGQGFGPDR